MAMDVEAEIRDLKRRVGELEGSFGFLTEQVKGVHRDLLKFQAETKQEFRKIHQRLDQHDSRFDRLERDVGGVRTEVRSLRADMPGIVADTMREVMGDAPKRPRKKQV